MIEKTSQKIITTSLLSPEKKQNFILSEDVEESIADETNEYDNIHKENNTYDQLGLSEPLSITYLGLGSKSDCSNTNLKCEVNKSLESKCEPQDDYLKPGKVIPDYLEILPSLD